MKSRALSPDRIDTKTEGWNYIFCRPGELTLLFVAGHFLRCQTAENAEFYPDKFMPDDRSINFQSIEKELSFPPFVGGPDQYSTDEIIAYLVDADARAAIHQVPLGWLICALGALEFVQVEGPEGDTWCQNIIQALRGIHHDNPEILELWPAERNKIKERLFGMIRGLRGPDIQEIEILDEREKLNEWQRQKNAELAAKKAKASNPQTQTDRTPQPQQPDELPEI